MNKVRLIVVGAGGRGSGYAQFAAENPDRLEIVGVAEPRDFYRAEMARKYNIPEKNVFTCWTDLAKRKKFADNDPSRIFSGPDANLESHLMVFAAEKSRKKGRVVNL